MEVDQHCSVYDLVTKLCERFLNAGGRRATRKQLQKLRARSYEILLSKLVPCSGAEILENNDDPLCHLLAWEFLLINEYNLPEHARKIQRCIESLQRLIPADDDDSFTSILYVLLQLRKPPELGGRISAHAAAAAEGCIKFRRFDELSFYLSAPMICSDAKFKDSSFSMRPVRKQTLRHLPSDECKDCLRVPSRTFCTSMGSLREEKESRNITTRMKVDKSDIWDLVSNTVYTERRTWETLGNPCPEPELPFLSESPSSVCSSFFDLRKACVTGFLTGFAVPPTKIIEQCTFIKHLKFLLVGMTSDSFKLNTKNELHLVDGFSIEGISQCALQKYTKDLIFCGACYKALNNLCNMSTQCYGNQHKGFIFREFCDSIKRYLSYYRVATLSLSEDSNLLKVHSHIMPLREHLDCLASICKVGPYTESLELPSGVALLNYLYQKLVGLTRNDVIMVLYSILYPCIQVYFSRFLQQWIFEGVVNDPYNEFFIHNSQKFTKARSRSYWTKSYIVQVDIVPDFLTELAQDILYCGKAMNLLKMCASSSPLCLYIMGKRPSLISCRLNSEQTNLLEQDSTCYYLEALAECGPAFSIKNVLTRINENKLIITDLATKKRAATIKRLEMEKLKKANKDFEEKQKMVANLKAEYDKALQDKKSAIIGDVVRELKHNEAMLKLHRLRKKIVEEEALKIIDYYDTLTEISERKRLGIERHIERLKRTDLLLDNQREVSGGSDRNSEEHIEVIRENVKTFESTSDSSFHSATSETAAVKEDEMFPSIGPTKAVTGCVCLDVANANSSSNSSYANSDDNIDNADGNNLLARIVSENKEAALRNKQRVMSVGLAIQSRMDPNENCRGEPKAELKELSELQKNRLKVMSSEFGLDLKIADLKRISDENIENSLKINSNRSIISGDNVCIDNENNMIEKNNVTNTIDCSIIDNNSTNNTVNDNSKDQDHLNNNNNDDDEANHNNYNNNSNKERNLKLDLSKISIPNEIASNTSIFSRFWKSPNFELGKPIPMSVDSTPCTGFSTTTADRDFSYSQSISTAVSNAAEDVFNFPKEKSLAEAHRIPPLSKRMPLADAEILSTDCLKLFIQQSVLVPVNVQTRLVNDELLRYFFAELDYLSHLSALRNYFFLLDGEFGRNITEGLFERLYDVDFPVDLINCRTLQSLVYRALDSSIRSQKDFACLSFKINDLPKTFDLSNPDVLDCLSLTYKVNWPLNVLLPLDIVSKYDEVFKFLLKLNRVSWVLKKIFQDLKLLSKKSGRRESFLTLSPEFNRTHTCRHIMTHFVQTLQNYVVGEVLQPSWSAFEKNLASVNSLNDLYNLHNSYVKDILFMCLLNKRFAPIRKVIQNTFVVILKFHHYLSAKQWVFDKEQGVFTHPNFQKLENIFLNFQEFVIYVFKAGRKVAKVGYQPHLVQLLDMLDVNGYYSKNTTESF